MKQSIRLGRIKGVPVGVHWSVAVIFGLVTWELSTIVLPDTYGGGARPAYLVAAVVAATLFLASLLAHEGSHAVVARRHGVGVRSITLWLLGGVAQLEGEAHTPGADFAIAAVGPSTSIFLAGVFGGAQLLLEQAGAPGLVVVVSSWLWQINLLLAGFNLIPAAPLDGGRILRAALWRSTGNRTRASVSAARAGMGFGVVLIGLGLFELLVRSPLGLWPALLGWFVFIAARAEGDAGPQPQGVEGLPVGAVMIPHPPVVPSAMSVAELRAGPLYWWNGHLVAAVVGPTGWLEGVVTLERIRHVPAYEQATTRLGDIAEPIESAPVGRPEEAMSSLLGRMHRAGGRAAVVLDPANRLAGIVTLDDVARAVDHGPRPRRRSPDHRVPHGPPPTPTRPPRLHSTLPLPRRRGATGPPVGFGPTGEVRHSVGDMAGIVFDATVVSPPCGSGALVVLPDTWATILGTRARVPVRATFNGIEYRGSLMPMGGGTFGLGLTKAIRSAAGVEIGDVVHVVVERDDEGRTVELPEDLSSALRGAGLHERFASLASTHRREYVAWVIGAKRAETRATRVAKAIDMVRAGQAPS